MGGEIEVDESYFGAGGKEREAGALPESPGFRLLKRGGRVYTKIIPDARADLDAHHRGRSFPTASFIATAGAATMCWTCRTSNTFGSTLEAVCRQAKPFNGIENFWNQAKRHMRKFNGVPREHFPLFLKECEWRFNNPQPQTQMKQVKQWVKEFLACCNSHVCELG